MPRPVSEEEDISTSRRRAIAGFDFNNRMLDIIIAPPNQPTAAAVFCSIFLCPIVLFCVWHTWHQRAVAHESLVAGRNKTKSVFAAYHNLFDRDFFANA
uniref:Uncharacterized protein n=1 Tax=Caenorhabditis japonica TaxID=281687 RepID=A0A8R1IUK9_CAEJA